MKHKHNNFRGFTIIEVVLVLAIAGLIFLMVFLALPALQRSQRDTQRKNDMLLIMSQLRAYQANNRGRTLPDFERNRAGFTQFEQSYLVPNGYTDPSTGENYKAILCKDGGSARCWDEPEVGEYMYNSAGWCLENGDYEDVSGNNANIVLRTKLESGGYLCISDKQK